MAEGDGIRASRVSIAEDVAKGRGLRVGRSDSTGRRVDLKNIAEGYGRESKSDFMHFLVMARGSLYEVETQLDLARSLGYLSVSDEIWALAGEIGRMLNGFISKLRTNH